MFVPKKYGTNSYFSILATTMPPKCHKFKYKIVCFIHTKLDIKTQILHILFYYKFSSRFIYLSADSKELKQNVLKMKLTFLVFFIFAMLVALGQV